MNPEHAPSRLWNRLSALMPGVTRADTASDQSKSDPFAGNARLPQSEQPLYRVRPDATPGGGEPLLERLYRGNKLDVLMEADTGLAERLCSRFPGKEFIMRPASDFGIEVLQPHGRYRPVEAELNVIVAVDAKAKS